MEELPMSGRGVHWVGDLALECAVEVQSESGELLLELVEGGRRFECGIDVATGEASLLIDGNPSYGSPKAQTKIRGPGSYTLRFANVDDQLRLWVGRREVAFDSATTYPPLGNHKPTVADLLPAGVASRGATLEVTRLSLFRDLYYIAARSHNRRDREPAIGDFDFTYPNPYGAQPMPVDVDRVLSNPEYWGIFADSRYIDLEMGEGQFLALGDNSAASQDSRLWAGEHYVTRDLLIGKALFIYWPHSEDRIPGTSIPFPFFPNFKRMWVIR